MKNYLFKTTTTMKEYNNDKWWICPDVVSDITIPADSLKKAIEQWVETVDKNHYITISKSAMKNRSKMYRDFQDGTTKECGFVVTGSTDFQDDRSYKWSKQYIDLWVECLTVDYATA